MTAAPTVPELAAVVSEAAHPAGDIRLTFTPHRAGVHLVMGSADLGPMLCGWVVGWTPGNQFPADTDWAMNIQFWPYARCQHPNQVVVW